LGFELQGGVI